MNDLITLSLASSLYQPVEQTVELLAAFNTGSLGKMKSVLKEFQKLKRNEYTLADQRSWAINAHKIGVIFENEKEMRKALKYYKIAINILLNGSENKLSLDDHANIMMSVEH